MDVDIDNRTFRSERVDFSNYSAAQLQGVLSCIRRSEYYAGRTDILRVAGWGKGHERWKTLRAAVPTEPNTLPPVIPLIVVGSFEAQALGGGGSAGPANPEVVEGEKVGYSGAPAVIHTDDEGFVGVQEECLRGVEDIVSAHGRRKARFQWVGTLSTDRNVCGSEDAFGCMKARSPTVSNFRLRDYVAFDVRGHRIPFSLLRSSLSGSIVMVTVSASAISINKEINGVFTPAISLALEVMEVQVLRAPLKAAQELVHPAQTSIARILSTKPVQTQPPVNGWSLCSTRVLRNKVHKGGFVAMPNAPNDPSRSLSKLPERVLQTPPVGHGQSSDSSASNRRRVSPDFTFDNVTQQDMALASRGKGAVDCLQSGTRAAQFWQERCLRTKQARKGGGRPLNGAHARSTAGKATSRRPTPSEPSNVLQLEDDAGHRMRAAVETHMPVPRSPVKARDNHATVSRIVARHVGVRNGNETVSVGDRQQVLAIFHRHGFSAETDPCQIFGERDGRVEVARTRVYKDGQHPGSPFPGHGNIGNGIVRAPSSRHGEVPANQRHQDVFSVDFSRDITRPSSQVPEERSLDGTANDQAYRRTKLGNVFRDVDGYERQGQMDAGSLQRNAVRPPSRIRDNAGIAVHSTGQSVQSMETAANITRPQSRVTRHSKRGHGEAGIVRSQSRAAAGDKVSNWSTELNDVNNEFAQAPLGIPGTAQVMSATGEYNKVSDCPVEQTGCRAITSSSLQERAAPGLAPHRSLERKRERETSKRTIGTELFVSAMNSYNERNSLNPQGNDYLWTGESIYSKELNDATVKRGTTHDSGAFNAATHPLTAIRARPSDLGALRILHRCTCKLPVCQTRSTMGWPLFIRRTRIRLTISNPTDGRAVEVAAFMENAMNLSPSSDPYGALWDIDFKGPLSVSLQDVQVTDIVKDDGHFGSYGADGVATDYSSGDTIYSSSSNSEEEYKLGRAGSSSSFEGSQSTSESSWESADHSDNSMSKVVPLETRKRRASMSYEETETEAKRHRLN
ncbi:hypothetical protein R3P38DRAFT_2801774 [Favolaschia claudopus]|uniref:Uncharacterized protein n=1 Tax=Favolaschia claudopus TaxID=2862362 RepID=A0AAV9ZV97_9AGAR